MARLSGVELQDKWRVNFGLTRLKGIGWYLADVILANLSIDKAKRFSDLSRDELAKIAVKLEEYTIEGDLARKLRSDIQRLQAIGSYRGTRHTKGLPARGQRTRSNARTKRGKRKTVGAFKKEVLSKMTTNDNKKTN